MLIKRAAIAFCALALAACYTVHNEDMFPIERAPLSDSELAALHFGDTQVERLAVADDVSFDSTRLGADRLIQKAIETSPGPVCLMGHSLGSWFPLDAGSRNDISNIVLAAIGTTPSDLTVAQAGIWRPLLWHSAEDDSLGPLDGVKMAHQTVKPVLIVTI